MIQVNELTKSYGPAEALRGISFDVQSGEIVGFLGPNGAGKSTTMKILTGYLLPTSGGAVVDGLDVVRDSLELRRRIGYLPESTPLYTEMRVDDYLRFVARIRGLRGRRVRGAVDRVVGLCRLEPVTGKNILELSKGFKQRVGLAQAMIHEPELLILDEPTSGLDPNQIVEVRSLIKRLSREHTVILSTHYLQEVEATCSRVIIVDLGRIVADAPQPELIGSMPAGAVRARIKGPSDGVLAQLGELLPGCEARVTSRAGEYAEYEVRASLSGTTVEEAVAHLVVKNDWALAGLARDRASLEDVFRSLTVAGSDRPHGARGRGEGKAEAHDQGHGAEVQHA